MVTRVGRAKLMVNSQEYAYTWNIVLENGPNNSQHSKDVNKLSLTVLKLEDLFLS